MMMMTIMINKTNFAPFFMLNLYLDTGRTQIKVLTTLPFFSFDCNFYMTKEYISFSTKTEDLNFR